MSIVDEINSATRALALNDQLWQLSPQDAERAISAAEKKFVTTPGVRWWWDALNSELPLSTHIDSDGGQEILTIICPDQEVWLFASDDEFPPWPVFVGRPADLAKVIGECHYFEYLVVSPSLDWAVIENHHNTFFAIGEPVASKLKTYVG